MERSSTNCGNFSHCYVYASLGIVRYTLFPSCFKHEFRSQSKSRKSSNYSSSALVIISLEIQWQMIAVETFAKFYSLEIYGLLCEYQHRIPYSSYWMGYRYTSKGRLCSVPGIRSEISIKKESEILVWIEIIPINSKFVHNAVATFWLHLYIAFLSSLGFHFWRTMCKKK